MPGPGIPRAFAWATAQARAQPMPQPNPPARPIAVREHALQPELDLRFESEPDVLSPTRQARPSAVDAERRTERSAVPSAEGESLEPLRHSSAKSAPGAVTSTTAGGPTIGEAVPVRGDVIGGMYRVEGEL